MAGSFGKMSVPAGMSPPVVEAKLASAISPVDAAAKRARGSPGPRSAREASTEYKSDEAAHPVAQAAVSEFGAR